MLHANSGQEVRVDHLAQSTPGEELVIFNQVPDGNGGQELPANPLFGELVTGTPVLVPTPAVKAVAAVPSGEVPTLGVEAPSVLWDAAQG